MKYLIFLFPVFLSSCFGDGESFLIQSLSIRKQKQKIAFLQKKLQLAQREKEQAEDYAENLVQEINEAELNLIRNQLNKYEKNKKKDPALFMNEREALYRMIQSGPSPAAFEAQVELDRILRIITELSDEEKHV